MAVNLLISASDATSKLTYTNSETAVVKTDHIRGAQYNYIRPALGETLYELIVAEKTASVWTGLNQTLYDDYLKDACSWFALAKAGFNIVNQSSSQGVFQHQPERTFGANDLSKFVQYCEEQGRDILSEMVEYIDENSTSFPDYAPETSGSVGQVVLY